MSGISGGVSDPLVTLPVDLDYPSTLLSGSAPYRLITNINASAGLTEILSLTGKYAICLLMLHDMTSEEITVKLTVDGEGKWNDTFTCNSQLALWNDFSDPAALKPPFRVNESLSLELDTLTDTNVQLYYTAIPL